jgi:antitoxin VapB
MPSLRIKNEETHRLIKELARLTGESQTTAVIVALQERLADLEKKNRASKAKMPIEGSSGRGPGG